MAKTEKPLFQWHESLGEENTKGWGLKISLFAYSESSGRSTMELFAEILTAFRKAPPQMFNWVVNTPLQVGICQRYLFTSKPELGALQH